MDGLLLILVQEYHIREPEGPQRVCGRTTVTGWYLRLSVEVLIRCGNSMEISNGSFSKIVMSIRLAHSSSLRWFYPGPLQGLFTGGPGRTIEVWKSGPGSKPRTRSQVLYNEYDGSHCNKSRKYRHGPFSRPVFVAEARRNRSRSTFKGLHLILLLTHEFSFYFVITVHRIGTERLEAVKAVRPPRTWPYSRARRSV